MWHRVSTVPLSHATLAIVVLVALAVIVGALECTLVPSSASQPPDDA